MSNELKLKYKWGQVVKYGSEGSKCVVVEVDTDEHTGLPYLVKHEYGGEEWCSEDGLSPWEPEQVEAQPIAQDSGWIKWNGGEQPVADDVEVEVVFKDDSGGVRKAHMVWWPDPALKRYRVVEQAIEQVTSPSLEEPSSMVISPKHYVLFPEQGIEVRHVNKAWMDKIDNEGEYVSHHEAAWLVQATQYIFRSPFKGSTIEDLNKAIQSIQYVVESMNARKASK